MSYEKISDFLAAADELQPLASDEEAIELEKEIEEIEEVDLDQFA